MSDKVLFRLVAILAVIILILFVLVAVLSNKKEDNETYYDRVISKQIDAIEKGEITGKYSSNDLNSDYLSLTQDDRDSIDRTIDYVFGLISNRDVDALYGLLKYDYRNARFYEKETLSEFLDEYFDREKSYKVDSYSIISKRLYVKLVDTSDEKISKTFRVDNYKNIEDINVYFGKFESIIKTGAPGKFGNVAVINYNMINYSDKTSLIITIYNEGKEKATIDFSGTTLYVYDLGQKKGFEIAPDTKFVFEAEPNSDSGKTYELYFNRVKGDIRELNYKVKVNGESYDVSRTIDVGAKDDYLD